VVKAVVMQNLRRINQINVIFKENAHDEQHKTQRQQQQLLTNMISFPERSKTSPHLCRATVTKA